MTSDVSKVLVNFILLSGSLPKSGPLGKYVHSDTFLQEIQFAGYVVVLSRSYAFSLIFYDRFQSKQIGFQ